MQQLTLDLPALYGDHHVLEVRRILLELPGVAHVYASSAFQVVEVAFDPAQVDAETIRMCLGQAGYLEPLAFPLESMSNEASGLTAYFRHTIAYKQTGRSVNFAQHAPYSGRPLWSCPGMGPVQRIDEGE